MSRPFSVKFNWDDFDNTSKLTSYQKHRIRKRYMIAVKDAIQQTIDQSVEDRANRRDDLEAHQDPEQAFKLDIGGEG
tara:strand:- start:341 stop:571 length:231 start_codon:yes stop_codon:yes gene_type:complete